MLHRSVALVRWPDREVSFGWYESILDEGSLFVAPVDRSATTSTPSARLCEDQRASLGAGRKPTR
jgi:hypothetical protein